MRCSGLDTPGTAATAAGDATTNVASNKEDTRVSNPLVGLATVLALLVIYELVRR